MKIRIVTDSGSNMHTDMVRDVRVVPLSICTETKEYRDDDGLDVTAMVEELEKTKGRSHTACPGVGDWTEHFEGADAVICIALAEGLSGTYNSARTAIETYWEDHPGKELFVINTNAIGPVEHLVADKALELAEETDDFNEICTRLSEYCAEHTSIAFCLESLTNLANNGRVSPLAAKAASILGIRIVGDFSKETGLLQPKHKCRGERRSVAQLVTSMKEAGYRGGRMIIEHCLGESAANALRDAVLAEYPEASIGMGVMTGLCSFYAERGGLVIGYEIG